ncbi:MAG: IS110 family transposase [Terrimonas sp.]|nr:IS110 family transposase [Terrimonas sp.]
MEKVTVFETVHEHAAGIDIGAEKIFVSPDGVEVVSFDTFTSGYYQCVEYLQQNNIAEVAMEATGVYWIALYAMLESCGFRVCLVNPKETKQIKGRKTDVKDCQWIQKLFSAGILRQSFIPEVNYMEVRQLVRERLDIIEMGSTYVNKMQKCLELMNIKLKEVISQIHGASGIKIIKAIIKGHRDNQYLLSLCDKRIRENKADLVLKVLEGNYNDTNVFMLEQNLYMWEKHQQQVSVIDKRIEMLLQKMTKEKKAVVLNGSPKLVRHHAPQIKGLHTMLIQLYGINMSSISGINDYTLLRLVGETGTDMGRFPNEKHFVSWCGLSPKHHQSGRVSKRVKGTKCNKAGQIFKEVAQGLLNSKYIAIGSFMRKLKSKKDSAIAIKAGARKLAIAYYNALTKGIDYVEQGTKKYEEQIKQREKSFLAKLAKKHNMELVEKQPAA